MSKLRAFLALSLRIIPLAILTFSGSFAQGKDIKISGMGIRKCSEWNQWKVAKSGEARAMTLEWAQGLISGHNLYSQAGKESSSAIVINSNLLVSLLDTYCEKNPEQRIFLGISDTIQNLGGAKLNLAPKPANQEGSTTDRKVERES